MIDINKINLNIYLMKTKRTLTVLALALVHLILLETTVIAQNVAKGKPATMTSTYDGATPASNCFDGDDYANGEDWICIT